MNTASQLFLFVAALVFAAGCEYERIDPEEQGGQTVRKLSEGQEAGKCFDLSQSVKAPSSELEDVAKWEALDEEAVLKMDSVEGYDRYSRRHTPSRKVTEKFRDAMRRDRNVDLQYAPPKLEHTGVRELPEHARGILAFDFFKEGLEVCCDTGIANVIVDLSVNAQGTSEWYMWGYELYTGGTLSGVVEIRDAGTEALLKREEFRFEDPVDETIPFTPEYMDARVTPNTVLCEMCSRDMMPYIKRLLEQVRDSTPNTDASKSPYRFRGNETRQPD